MAKPLFYRLFGIGKLPESIMSPLQTEGIVLFDEAVKGSVTYRNFHKPGKRTAWERRWFRGAIVLTKARLLALWGADPLINVPLADPRLGSMEFSFEGKDVFCTRFDAGLFHDDWSGTIEYRFHTDQAKQFLELTQKAVALTANSRNAAQE